MLAQTIITFLALALAVSASPLSPRQIASSGNDGEGNQDVGNKGQNAGNSAANKGTVKGDYTVEQGVQTCGNAQLNCCNKIEKKGDTTSAGLLGSLFGSGDIGLQCTPINVPVVARKFFLVYHLMVQNANLFPLLVQVPINKACDAKAACCQGEVSQVRFNISKYSFPALTICRTVLSTWAVLPLRLSSNDVLSAPWFYGICWIAIMFG